MLDIVRGWVAFISAHPALLAALLGTLGAQPVGIAIETYYIPETWPQRRQKQVVTPLIVGFAWSFTVIVWSWLDPTVPGLERYEFAVPIALISWLVYPPIGRWLTGKFPAIASAWADRGHLEDGQ